MDSVHPLYCNSGIDGTLGNAMPGRARSREASIRSSRFLFFTWPNALKTPTEDSLASAACRLAGRCDFPTRLYLACGFWRALPWINSTSGSPAIRSTVTALAVTRLPLITYQAYIRVSHFRIYLRINHSLGTGRCLNLEKRGRMRLVMYSCRGGPRARVATAAARYAYGGGSGRVRPPRACAWTGKRVIAVMWVLAIYIAPRALRALGPHIYICVCDAYGLQLRCLELRKWVHGLLSQCP